MTASAETELTARLTRTVSYRGDHTQPYDPATKAGTVGRVMGVRGAWYRATEATYDAETNRTTVHLRRLIDPLTALDQQAE